jgi:glycosyltransferase involved in cell wall biosynthesis
VSIVTPYFNTGRVFDETVESVVRQTLQAWEWIIVNDGSTDGAALKTLARYRDGDRRIRIIDHDVNRGPGAARNSGFAAARTEYVVQLDSDDLLEPTALEKLFWFMESHPTFAFAKGYTVGFGAESYVWVNGFHYGDAFLEGNKAGITAIVRQRVHQEVGGYDEANREGLEDWDFWLNCANRGYWGGTIHEPLSWYRRRPAHGDQWGNWDGGDREESFRRELQRRYPDLWTGAFPKPDLQRDIEYEPVPDDLPVGNELGKTAPRILFVVPWLAVGGADKANLDAVAHLVDRGWEVTIATTLDGDHSWESEFARYTSDIFALHRFLRPADFPRFLRYLIRSRGVDVVLISNSELGYQLLPYLRSRCPEPTYMDLAHAEQDDWKSGGHPNLSNLARDQIDLTVVVSKHLRGWLIDHGGDGSRIAVCHLGVDAEHWRPDALERRRVRDDLGVAEETTVILFGGRLAKEKQPGVFAETILKLSRSHHDVVALVVGDGPDRPWLEAYRTDHLLDDQIVMLGSVGSDRMLELFRAADVFFLPSEREGIALTIFEAMSCGVAVVAADVGGQSELVTPETGILVRRGEALEEVDAYTYALGSLVRDAERRNAMGVAARERIVGGFSLAAMGDCLERVIAKARSLSEVEPRALVPVDSARAMATLAVDYHRLSRVAAQPTQVGIGFADPGAGGGFGDVDNPRLDPTAWWQRLSPGRRVYALLMAVLGVPYRWLKRRNPRLVAGLRKRVRSLLGYHR